jgi:hypothetical protein
MPEAQFIERRRVQRVRLTQPLRATLDGTRVFIVDLSLQGLRVLHQDDAGQVGSAVVLRAEWDGTRLELHCTIVRTALHKAADGKSGRSLYHSGLAITQAVGTSELSLRRLIEYHVERARGEQKANARGIPPLAAQSVQTGAPTTYVRHEYTLGRWREVMTPSPAQPESGFTIAADHSAAEVEMLRRAYERAATNSDRAVIRRLAALSLSSSEVVQARRYVP